MKYFHINESIHYRHEKFLDMIDSDVLIGAWKKIRAWQSVQVKHTENFFQRNENLKGKTR